MSRELVKCDCCGGSMSANAQTCPLCGDVVARASLHEKFAWLVTFLLSIGSLLGVIYALFIASPISAPQQCALIAGCIGMTVIPYCYARCVEKF